LKKPKENPLGPEALSPFRFLTTSHSSKSLSNHEPSSSPMA